MNFIFLKIFLQSNAVANLYLRPNQILPSGIDRQGANAGDKSGGMAGANASGSGSVDNIQSPGDSDPDDYLDMVRDVTKNVEPNKS